MLGSNKRQAFPATTTQKSSKEEREEEEKLWRSEAALEQLQQDQRHREFSFPRFLSLTLSCCLLFSPLHSFTHYRLALKDMPGFTN